MVELHISFCHLNRRPQSWHFFIWLSCTIILPVTIHVLYPLQLRFFPILLKECVYGTPHIAVAFRFHAVHLGYLLIAKNRRLPLFLISKKSAKRVDELNKKY